MDTNNAYDSVRDFEVRVAEWAGARFGVAVESCTAALFLSCIYKKVGYTVIPKRTYPSVPCSILNAGGIVGFSDEEWSGVYELKPYGIIDGALRFCRGMYRGGLHCLSFHVKKQLPIGRGGMILTDDEEAAHWFKRARFDGRAELPLLQDEYTMTGYNMYMTPEQASRGLQLFELLKNKELPDLSTKDQDYPDLSQFPIYGSGLITLRNVTMADAADLLKWKNEADTRRNSLLPEVVIEMKDHLVWLERTLSDPSVQFFIIEKDGRAVGDLRLNEGSDETEVSIRLDREFRGQGLATRVISMVPRGKPLMAKIVSHNIPSMRVFIANGYRPAEYCDTTPSYYVFRKPQ